MNYVSFILSSNLFSRNAKSNILLTLESCRGNEITQKYFVVLEAGGRDHRRRSSSIGLTWFSLSLHFSTFLPYLGPPEDRKTQIIIVYESVVKSLFLVE